MEDNINLEQLNYSYKNILSQKNKEIQSLNNRILINQNKLNAINEENENIKEKNYNLKILYQKYNSMKYNNENEQMKDKKNKLNKNKINYRQKFVETIEDDNINYMKNSLIEKICKYYNNINKIVGKDNKEAINIHKLDLNNYENLLELQKKLKIIEENVFH